MKFFLISNSRDTLTGLRMAGIEGILCREAAEVLTALEKAAADPEVAVILITSPLADLCRRDLDDWRLHRSFPLVTAIPDRHGEGGGREDILRYVRDAVGINL